MYILSSFLAFRVAALLLPISEYQTSFVPSFEKLLLFYHLNDCIVCDVRIYIFFWYFKKKTFCAENQVNENSQIGYVG